MFAPRLEEDFDMQIAENLTLQSLAQCFAKDPADVKGMVLKMGDYGDVAVSLRSQVERARHETQLLTLDSIVDAAIALNSLTGDDSVQKKVDLMANLSKKCQSEDELRFLVRSFANTGLRIGLSTKSVEKCIIEYFKSSGAPNSSQRLRDFERGVFGYRIQSLSAEAQAPIYDVPIKAMVGRSAKSCANVIEELGNSIDKSRLVADFKYDGERTQIHSFRSKFTQRGHNISLFSRNFDRQDAKFWHFKSLLAQTIGSNARDFIIDGELVYLDQSNKMLPF